MIPARIALADACARLERSASGVTHLSGVFGSAAALLSHALAASRSIPVVHVVADMDAARRTIADLRHFAEHCPLRPAGQCAGEHPPAPMLTLSAGEGALYAETLADRAATLEQLHTLYHLAEKQPFSVLVCPISALATRVIPTSAVAGLHLQVGQTLDAPHVATYLAELGYLRAPLAEDPGSFAVRGGLLDIWPAPLAQPVRVELLGDEVAAIRAFDAGSQRSLHALDRVVVPPATPICTTTTDHARARQRLTALCEAVNLPSSQTRALITDLVDSHAALGLGAYLPAFHDLIPLTQYLTQHALFVIDDPSAVSRALREYWDTLCSHEPPGAKPHYLPGALAQSEEDLFEQISNHRVLCLHRAAVTGKEAPTGWASWEVAPANTPSLESRDHQELQNRLSEQRHGLGKQASLDPLFEALAQFREQGLRVEISARSSAQAVRLTSLLEHHDLRQSDTGLRVVVGRLARGMIAELSGFALLTEEEIFGSRSHRSSASRSAKNALDDLRSLEIGDFVVHVDHGVGRYLGFERRHIDSKNSVELLVIEYAASDRLLLPVYRLNQLQKYLGKESSPRLDRLGGATFSKTKARVRKHVREMADELLRLYADRAHVNKNPLPALDDDYATFEAQFPFEETPDQAAAIQEVLRDLEKPQVMDRLVCGDVGFGKTEVALRAAFRHAMNGRQVALLCPTTVLAQQHFQTFHSRLSTTPIRVRVLSRFQSAQEQREVVEQIRSGNVDLVVGTHRLLSRDVHFKNLGLLIIDEEQRFGVSHKERIKQLRTNIDVLTLTATPIPRTLQLAVGGMRDLSVIATPPEDRRAIRTLIARDDDNTVREAIRRELQRGGQVYYVYNRVEDIQERATRLARIVPEARIGVAHGQMKPATLEHTMLGFVSGKLDILVCTAIIESGLDIPRANTMLIDRAELFGLAQLHQLRGRVGRSPRRAYCYLLVPLPSALTSEARARVEALVRYGELGSGLNLATLDMELRGTGDLLGAEQSGSVASVGFQLFCQMLSEASEELRGIEVIHEIDPELSFDVEALLPEQYIEDIGLRLSLYKRLASALDEAHVVALAAEMEDRFGPPPPQVERLIELMRIKVELRRLRVLVCEASARAVTLHLSDDTPLDRDKILERVGQRGSLYRITPDRRLIRRKSDAESFVNGLGLAGKVLSELQTLC